MLGQCPQEKWMRPWRRRQPKKLNMGSKEHHVRTTKVPTVKILNVMRKAGCTHVCKGRGLPS